MKKLLALILSVLMIASLAACTSSTDNDKTDDGTKESTTQKSDENGDNGDNDTKPTEKPAGDDNTDEGEKLPTDENAILKYVLDALTATVNYKGDITINASSNSYSNQTMGTEVEERTYVEKELSSFDATNKLRYWETVDENSIYGNSTSFNKTFVIDNTLYGMEKASYPNSTEPIEDYFKIHDSSKAEYQTSDQDEIFESIFDMYEGFTLAENMAEIKSSFDTAIPVLFDEMYDVDEVKPTITKQIIAESKDGACTLRINIDSSLSLVRDGVDMAMFINMHTVISAKDGKIVDFTMDLDTEQKAVQGDNILQKFTQKAIHALTVEYKFAKDKYDALVANLPTDAEEIHVVGAPAEDYSDVKTTVYVNGAESETAWYDGVETPQMAFDKILDSSRLDMEKVTVKVFKDEAKTQEITRDSITKEDVLALDKVYVEATPVDCALVIVKYSTRYEYSKPYKIVVPFVSTVGFGASHQRMQPPSCYDAGEYTLDISSFNDEYCEIWINGAKQEPKERVITLENNTLYIIEYVTVISENNLEI